MVCFAYLVAAVAAVLLVLVGLWPLAVVWVGFVVLLTVLEALK